jgi:hypothetical protein
MNEAILFLALGVPVVLLYFLPSIVASKRNYKHANSVVVLNTVFGWTLLGWAICLAMAVSGGAAGKA